MTGSGLVAPFSFKGGSYPGIGGDCGAALAASGTCNIVVTYLPSATGAHADAIDINYNDGVSPRLVSRNIQGTATTPASLAISATNPYNYGAAGIGVPVDHTFTVTNSGGVAATTISGTGLAAPYTFRGGSFPGTGGGDCTATLAPSATCNIVVTFNPSSTGVFGDTIQIDYADGTPIATNTTRDVTGTGVNLALLSISNGPSFNYGIVAYGSVNDQAFTVTNTGDVTAAVMNGIGLVAPFRYKDGTYPGTGGNCGASLAASGSCIIVVSFAPIVVGIFTDQIEVVYNDGQSLQTAYRQVDGEGQNPASLTIAPAPLSFSDWGTVATGSTTTMTFDVTNIGDVSATALSGAAFTDEFQFAGGAYPGTSGTCGLTLAGAGTTCTIRVSFVPTSNGFQSDQIRINYNDGTATPRNRTHNIQGNANPPAVIAATPASHNFGMVVVGNTLEVFIQLDNTGGVDATAMNGAGLVVPYSFKGGAYPGTGGSCGAVLNPGSNCHIVITYQPVSSGTFPATALISYDNGVAPGQLRTIALTGTATSGALLNISDANPYDFGIKGTNTTTTKNFVVTNTGGALASSITGAALVAPFAWVGGSFPGTGGNCSANLPVGNSCQIQIEYSPVTGGIHSGTLQLNFFDGSVATSSTKTLAATASALAFLQVTNPVAATVNFGNRVVNTNRDITFTIVNNGGVDATSMAGTGLAAPFTYKGGAYPGIGGNCSTVLVPTATCDFVVTFTPTVAGAFNDTISIDHNNGAATVSLTKDINGIGSNAGLMAFNEPIAPTANISVFNFGIVANTATPILTVEMENIGGTTMTAIADALTLAAPFQFAGTGYPGTGGNCSTALAPGATCDLRVRYSPTVTGAHSSTLTLDYNDGDVVQQKVLTVQGSSDAPAVLTVSDPGFNYGTITTGASVTKVFTLTNTGGVPIAVGNITNGGGLAAPFTYVGGAFPGTGGDCGTAIVNPGGNCTIAVAYAPITGAVHNGTISVNYYNGLSTQTATRAITGTGQSAASLAISDVGYDYGNVSIGAVVEKTFTITNSGTTQATGMADGLGLAAPYNWKGGSYPGTGTCGATLNGGGATCTIIVTFSPTGAGAASDTILVDYNTGVANTTANRLITGTGRTTAVLTISNLPTTNYGTVATNSSTHLTFTMTNSGQVSATSVADGLGLAAPFNWRLPAGAFPGTGGTCTGTLGAGASCTMVVTYNPTVNGNHNDTILVDYHNGTASQQTSLAIQGIAANPAVITISDAAPYDFGNVALNSSTDKTFTLTNTGGAAATGLTGNGLAAPIIFKTTGTFPGSGGTCTGTLNGGSTCTIVVNFNPTTAGFKTDTVNIDYNNGISAQQTTRVINGTSIDVAILAISDPAYNYGNVTLNTSMDKTFTVTNNGGVNATVVADGLGLGAPYTWKGGTYPGTAGTCGIAPVAPAGNCTVVVTFTPTITGAQPDTMILTYNDGLAAQSTSRLITGTGISLASIAISDGPTYSYGTIAANTTANKTFTLTNSGTTQATGIADGLGLAAPFTWPGGTFPGGGTCGANLNGSGATCTIIVRYSPVANGVSSDQIIVNYNNGNAVVPATRDIQGVAADPALLTISNSPNFDYGNRVLSTNTDQTFTLTNSGGVTATTMADDFGLAAPFNWKGGTYPGTGGTCTGVATVAPLASCTIVVTYTPTVVGPHSDTISVRYNNGLATVTTQRDVLGTGVSIATLTISDSDPYGFGTVAATTTNYKTFTITNTGSGAASSMADGLGLAAPFSFKDGTYPGNGGSCNTALASLATCTIIVAYNPAANGSHSDGLIVSYFNGVSSQNLTKTLNGTAAAAANVAVSDGPGTYNYGNVSTSSSADHTFTLTNNGGVIATTMGDGFGLAVPFNWKTSGNYPGTGTCGLTLAPTSSCTVIVTFSPAIAAVSSDTLVVNYHNGLIATNTTRDVTGTGVNAAVLTISNGATYNFGGRVIGTNTDFTFTVSRTGSLNATGLNGTGLAAPFTFKGGSYPGSGGTCDTDLTVGEGTCTIVVTYSPTASGVQSDQIVLNYNDGVTTQQALRDVTGTGQIPASVSISDAATYDYGSRAIGSNTDHTFTLTRTGDVDATGMADGLGLAAPYNWKDGTYPGTGGNCGPTLTVASSTCTIVVTFSPTGSGTFNDAILVNYNNGVSGQQASRAVTGAASVSPAVLTISNGATYDYGSKVIGSNTDFTFTVSRTGSATATSLSGAGLAAPFTFKGGSYPGSGGSCDSDLTVGEGTCTIVVTYSPTASGAHSDQIVLNYNDGAAAQQAVRDVTGTGQIPATVTISDASTYDYGSKTIGSNTDKTFTLTRTGDVDATGLADGLGLAAPYNWKGGSYPGTPGGTCNNSLTVASSTCTIVVTYSPVAGGTFNDAIIMNYNDGVAAQQAVRAVTGSASTAAVITVSDGPTYNYGTNTYNTAIHKTFTLTNSGGVDATSVGDGFGLAAPYTWKTSGTYPGAGGTCGATLTAGNSCTVFVTYTPTTGGIHNDTLDVSYNDGSATQHATRDVTGLVVASSYCANKLANSPFAGGTGTAPDPYTICTPAQFLNIPTQLSANFSQRDNLNFSGVTFTPVGTNAAPLTGSYDGKNFDISNVLYNNNTVDYVGLFGGSSGVLKNIKMLNANITGRDYVGGIVGRMNGGSLSYSSVSGTGITGQDFVGGVVGQASSGSITKSWSNLNVTGIAGSDGVGGFVGSSAIAITESYTKTATVSGVNKIGGFAGEVTANTISDSYAAETVSGTTKVGGFTGESSGGSFARVHSVGSVSGTTNVGGLMGSKSGGGSETNSYWNTTTSTRGTSAGSESGLTSANMALLSNFTNFNFNSVWRLDSAYPQLSFASYNTLTNPLSYYRLESFEGTGTVETWGAGGVTAPNSVDDDSTAYITSNTPGIWGSQSFRVTTSNSAVDDLAYKTLAFTGRNHSWTSFDVAFSTLPTPVTASISVFKTLDSGASATAVAVDLINDGGANRLAFNVYHNGSANQYTWPSSGSIQTGQIYRVNMLWDTNYDVWQIRVNGQTVLTGNLTGSAASLAVGYFIAGSDLGNSPMTLVYDLDNIRISEAPSEAITQTSETTITLSTSGTPDSCQLTNLTNATITSPCSCTSGVCSVKLKGTSSGTGRFDYTATSNGQVSPPASVDLSIP